MLYHTKASIKIISHSNIVVHLISSKLLESCLFDTKRIEYTRKLNSFKVILHQDGFR